MGGVGQHREDVWGRPLDMAGVVPVQASLTARQVKMMLVCGVGSNNANVIKIFEGKSYSTYSYVRL